MEITEYRNCEFHATNYYTKLINGWSTTINSSDVKFVSPHLFLTNWVVILIVLLSSSVSYSNSVLLCFVVFCISNNLYFNILK